MAYHPGVYKTSGGYEQVVASSGNIAVHSGGAITLAGLPRLSWNATGKVSSILNN